MAADNSSLLGDRRFSSIYINEASKFNMLKSLAFKLDCSILINNVFLQYYFC